VGKIKRLTIYSDKVLGDKKILLVSDLHKQKDTKEKHLKELKNKLDSEFTAIDYIVIPGDIVNDASDLISQSFKRRLQEELSEFISDKKTIVSPGNHDQMTMSDLKKWTKGNSELIFTELKGIPNMKILRNGENIVDNEISFSAFTPRVEYYTENKEDKDLFKEEFYKIYNEHLFRPQNYNILLTHEPQSIIELSKLNNQCIQPNTDLVVSGHMHNGLLPNIFHAFCKNRGILSPQLELFPKYAQGTYKVGDTTFVINGALNIRIETPIINDLYGYNATIIDIKKSPQKTKKR